ncbi:tetratricopeptide repeat family protein [Chrysochromulina tobinii]|uniref:Tetratricopeptide repeat family protein n=1 Tax=Chrysochromulina tobinii TaxID=1460289 RepID=A0A0M0K0R0_9EUKA|nr:tetratricopeptide repeat family protein [Chrysochromulina tobinii]|eukprot:KOO32187.1 tetratricopeptide repeat family protein [Chrysochromulina sp. CCMP291]
MSVVTLGTLYIERYSTVGGGKLLPDFLFLQGESDGLSQELGLSIGGGHGRPVPFVPDDSCDDAIFDGASPDLRSPILPYLKQDTWGCERTPAELPTVLISSTTMEAEIVPQFGGKLWGMRDKFSGRDFFFRNPAHQPANIGARGAWAAGGLEFNWAPGYLGHSAFTEERVWAARLQTARDTGDYFLRIPPGSRHWIAHVSDDTEYVAVHGHGLNGTKFFTWGQSGPGRFMQDFLGGLSGGPPVGESERAGDYTELQTGVQPTQQQVFTLPANSSIAFTEYYKPFRRNGSSTPLPADYADATAELPGATTGELPISSPWSKRLEALTAEAEAALLDSDTIRLARIILQVGQKTDDGYLAALSTLGAECFPTFGRGRDALLQLWKSAVVGKAAVAEGRVLTPVEAHRARKAMPVPRNLGCPYATLYCEDYW